MQENNNIDDVTEDVNTDAAEKRSVPIKGKAAIAATCAAVCAIAVCGMAWNANMHAGKSYEKPESVESDMLLAQTSDEDETSWEQDTEDEDTYVEDEESGNNKEDSISMAMGGSPDAEADATASATDENEWYSFDSADSSASSEASQSADSAISSASNEHTSMQPTGEATSSSSPKASNAATDTSDSTSVSKNGTSASPSNSPAQQPSQSSPAAPQTPESSSATPSTPKHVHSWRSYETVVEAGRYEVVDKGTTRPMLYVYDASGALSNQYLPGNTKEAQEWADKVGGYVELVQAKNTVTLWYSPRYEYGKKCSCGEKIVEGTKGGTKTCIAGHA